MFNLLKTEIYKLKRYKLFYFTILLAASQSCLIYMFSDSLSAKTGKDILKFSCSTQECLALTLLIGVFSSDYVISEFYSGYIKNLIAYGHKRRDIYISKCMTGCIAIVLMSFMFPIIITIGNTIRNGYGEAFNIYSFIYLVRVGFFMILIASAMGSLAILVGFIFRNVIFTMGLFICFDTINRTFGAVAMKNNIMRVIYYKTIMSQPQIATLDKISFQQGLQIIIVSLSTILVSTLLGIYIFKKRDI